MVVVVFAADFVLPSAPRPVCASRVEVTVASEIVDGNFAHDGLALRR